MDISTLPDEMLTNILKYTPFGKRIQIRKMNARMDKLAMRSKDCRRVSLERFDLFMGDVTVCLSSSDAQELGLERAAYFKPKLSDELVCKKNLEEFLPLVKIQRLNISWIETFDEELFNLLKRHHKTFRNLTHIKLHADNYALSKSSTKMFLRKMFPNLDNLEIYVDNGPVKYFCSKKVLGFRKWKNLVIESKKSVEFMNDNLLLEFAPSCRRLRLCLGSASITLNCVLDMMQECIARGKYKSKIDLAPVIVKDLTFEDIKNLLNIYFPDCVISTRKDKYYNRYFKVTFGDKDNAPYLEFNVGPPDDEW